MLAHLADLASQLVALAPTPAPTGPAAPPTADIDTNALITFVVSRLVPLGCAILGIVFLFQARRGQMSQVTTSSAIAIWGIVFILGGGAFVLFGGAIVDMIIE